MTALVTGGAGFIGSHLVARLRAEEQVQVLDQPGAGVMDRRGLEQAMAGVDVVYHLAALPGVARSVAEPLESNRVNVDGTLNVLMAAEASGVRRVVFASSSSVYGGTKGRLMPRSPYAVTKAAGEMYCRVWAHLSDLDTVNLRLFNVYGPGQRADPPHGGAVVPLFIWRLTHYYAPIVHGDGHQQRDFTFVSDVAEAFMAAGRYEGELAGATFDIGRGEPRTVLDLLDELYRQIGAAALGHAVHTQSRPGDVEYSCADPTRAYDVFGWRARVGLRDGLARTLAWVQEQTPGAALSPATG